jgi:hypothetical protein
MALNLAGMCCAGKWAGSSGSEAVLTLRWKGQKGSQMRAKGEWKQTVYSGREKEHHVNKI